MSKSYAALFLLSALIFSCSIPKSPIEGLWESLDELPQLTGKSGYLKSPFTAAGDRLYLIGNQDGSFSGYGMACGRRNGWNLDAPHQINGWIYSFNQLWRDEHLS